MSSDTEQSIGSGEDDEQMSSEDYAMALVRFLKKCKPKKGQKPNFTRMQGGLV